jgi:hypothetical protein
MLTFELEQILERRFQSQSKNDYVNAVKKVMRIANYHSNHSDWLQAMIMYALYKTPWWGSAMMAVAGTAGRNLIVYNVGSARVELWRWNHQIDRTQEANMQTQTTTRADCTPYRLSSRTACLSRDASTPWTPYNCQQEVSRGRVIKWNNIQIDDVVLTLTDGIYQHVCREMIECWSTRLLGRVSGRTKCKFSQRPLSPKPNWRQRILEHGMMT